MHLQFSIPFLKPSWIPHVFRTTAPDILIHLRGQLKVTKSNVWTVERSRLSFDVHLCQETGWNCGLEHCLRAGDTDPKEKTLTFFDEILSELP